MSKTRLFLRLLGRGGWLVAAKASLALFAIVFAASITVVPNTFTAEIGWITLNSNNGLIPADRGFSVASAGLNANGTSCSAPVTFTSSLETARTNVTAGDLVYDVLVNSTASAMSNQTFNVRFFLGSASFGPLCVKTPSPVVGGERIECRFDIGTSILPSTTYSFKVSIQ